MSLQNNNNAKTKSCKMGVNCDCIFPCSLIQQEKFDGSINNPIDINKCCSVCADIIRKTGARACSKCGLYYNYSSIDLNKIFPNTCSKCVAKSPITLEELETIEINISDNNKKKRKLKESGKTTGGLKKQKKQQSKEQEEEESKKEYAIITILDRNASYLLPIDFIQMHSVNITFLQQPSKEKVSKWTILRNQNDLTGARTEALMIQKKLDECAKMISKWNEYKLSIDQYQEFDNDICIKRFYQCSYSLVPFGADIALDLIGYMEKENKK